MTIILIRIWTVIVATDGLACLVALLSMRKNLNARLRWHLGTLAIESLLLLMTVLFIPTPGAHAPDLKLHLSVPEGNPAFLLFTSLWLLSRLPKMLGVWYMLGWFGLSHGD